MADNMSYIYNGKVKIGINLDIGGAITYLSKSGSDQNLINSCDWGRQIQMSHYSGPTPFEPKGLKPNAAWTFIGWNPIQAGDCYGNGSKVLAHKRTGNSLYVKCIPMHWPLNNFPGECTYECWITLKNNTVQVRSRMLNSRPDKTQYSARGQELPAVYTNGSWWKLMTYLGDKPFTRGELTQTPAAFMWKWFFPTENWAALVNNEGWGIGIYEPGIYTYVAGFAGEPGSGGPKDGNTGYMAPMAEEILDHNIDTSFNYVLILGNLKEIRDYVYKQPRPAIHPSWVFENSRHYWAYEQATDAGWPIRNELNVDLSHNNATINSPRFFIDAKQNPILYIRAAFSANEFHMALTWEKRDLRKIHDWDKADPYVYTDKQRVNFPVIGDGEFRTYKVDLSKHSEWTGIISRLKLISPLGEKEKRVRIISIGFVNPDTSKTQR